MEDLGSKAVANGDSLRPIASRFGVTAAAAHRHLRGCLCIVRRAEEPATDAERAASASPRFDSSEGEISSPADLLKRLQKLFRLGDRVGEAYQRRDVDAVVKLARG